MWLLLPFALITASQARSRVGGPVSEAGLCRGAVVVLVGKVGENRAWSPGSTADARIPIEIEGIVFLDESRPGKDRLRDLSLAEIGESRDAYRPGARHVFVLQYVDYVEELSPQWFRVYSRPLPDESGNPPLEDLQHYWALHCSGVRDDLRPTKSGWWTWWYEDPFRTSGCEHD